MFLKKIKIDGFKSFANAIVIDFPAPFTAIVGPNGSGKSNIVDAIRWALGEQSAKSLRGGKMADIIFAGSADYKPLEKASVTLYFDNTDNRLPCEKKQVRIKRCVSREGQSDYFLNGKSCRLKDIEELLMDTGLGNESYSIVGQGKIDTILNSKPEKLRELFEEAAGIVKHKNRKEDAEKRLEQTRQDLQRIKDLLWELEKQVKPLKRSAEKVHKYNRLKKELEELEVNLLLDQWEGNDNLLTERRKDEKFLQGKLSSLEEEIENLKRTLEEKTGEQELEEDTVEELKDSLYQVRSKREQAENNLKILVERDSGLRREGESHRRQFANLRDDLARLKKKEEEITGKLVDIGIKDEEINKRLVKVENESKTIKALLNEKKKDLDNRRNSILNENMELNDLQSELEKRREKGHYLEIEIDKLAEKKKSVSGEFDEILLQKKDLLEKGDSLEKELLFRNNEVLAYKKREKELENQIIKQEKDIEAIKNRINHSESRLKLLEDMEEDFQGYFRGVKNILRHQDKIPGIIGVIADLIDVDKRYELAIETALGAKLQNIVTEDEQIAKKAVKYLKESKGGKATFLPLNLVRGKKARIDKIGIDHLDGYIGLASDIIGYQGELEEVIYSLLGKTLVTEDLDNAVEIAKKIKSNLKIVTLDGEYINTSGAITGGSQNNNNQGLLGRSREINELKGRLSELNDIFGKESEKREKLREEHDELIRLQKRKEEEINRLEFEKNDLSKDILNLEKENKRLERELELIDRDFEEYHNQLGINDNLLQCLEKELSIINSEYSKERDEISNKELEVRKLEGEEEERNRLLTEIKIELATIAQQKDSIFTEKESLKTDLANFISRKKEMKDALKEIEEKLKNIEERKAELLEMKREFSLQKEELEEKYKKHQEVLVEKEQNVKRLQQNYNKGQADLNKIKDEYHKIILSITRMEDKNIQIAEQLMEEYGVDPEKGISERIRIEDYSRVNQKVRELKEVIKKLGPVNLAAVDEYEELTTRLDYLREQQEDLLQARASVEKVIEELERNMSDLFYQAFVDVKNEFEKTFEELFNGGKAELRLTRPEDLLETGVEIEAQPPGKQLKKLSLMSGGERALTAIALVFAFLKVNPSPMYILDEIDAPLDDANVRRFANYLKEYSQYVQFILITHNKLMMSEANVIYGITMEEKGVSKIVSLRLDEEIA